MTQEIDNEKLGQAEVEGELRPRVKQGVYELAFSHQETARLFNGRALKLVLWFKITSHGEYFGIMLPRFYNIKSTKGKVGRNGNFTISPNCDFIREYATLFKLPNRFDRIPMSVFKNKIFIGGVRTVIKGFQQSKIPDSLQYSVIGSLKQVKVL